MQITIGQSKYDFDEKSKKPEELFILINEILFSKELIFNYLVIDGNEIKDKQEEYILDNYSEIRSIEIIAFTGDQYIKNLWSTMSIYLNDIIPEVDSLSKEFYINKDNKVWENILGLFDVADQIIGSFNQASSVISSEKAVIDEHVWKEYMTLIEKLNMEIMSLAKPMEQKDTIMIGDILKWKICPTMNLIQKKLIEYI